MVDMANKKTDWHFWKTFSIVAGLPFLLFVFFIWMIWFSPCWTWGWASITDVPSRCVREFR